VYSLVALAIVLRLAYYFINPTLSTDEAQLALNLRHQPYSALIDPLDFNQAAPIGFLVVQKLVTDAVGGSEYALRMFPLLSALVASVIFYPVASRFVGARAARVALILFAVSELLLVYSATAKQYSIDVTITLALYWLVLCIPPTLTRSQIFLLAAVGAGAVWVSHAAIFVLAGVSIVLVLESALARQWRRVLQLTCISTVWVASFAGFYLLLRQSYTYLQQSFAGNAAVLGADDTWNGEGRARVYGGMVRALFGIPHVTFALRNALTLIAIAFCLVGATALLVTWRRRAFLLISPAAFALVASALGKYPLFPRTLLFLVPGLLMTAAYGLQVFKQQVPVQWMKAGGVVAFSAVLLAAASVPANQVRLRDGGELKQAMRYVGDHQRPGESLYVYSAAQYDLRYYLECGCFARASTVRRALTLWPLDPEPGGVDQDAPTMRSVPPVLVVGSSTSDVPADYRADFAQLLGRRVWIVTAAASPESRRALTSFLNSVGTRKRSFRTDGDIAAAELYDLSG